MKPTQTSAHVATLIERVTCLTRIEAALDRETSGQNEKAINRAYESYFKAEDALYQLIYKLLSTRRDDVLSTALDKLYAQNQLVQLEELEASLVTCCSSVNMEATTGAVCHELFLVPVLVNEDYSTTGMDPATLSGIVDTGHSFFESGADVRQLVVDPQLWHPDEVYGLTYSAMYARNIAPAPAVLSSRVGCRVVASTTSATPSLALRFLAIWVQTTSAHYDMVEAATAQERTTCEQWMRAAARHLAVSFGEPVQLGTPFHVVEARKAGMDLYNMFSAHSNISNQLKMRGLFGTPLNFCLSLHGDPCGGPDGGVVEQARLSLLDREGRLVAGHVMAVDEWCSPEEVTDLALTLLQAYGRDMLHTVDTLRDLAEDAEMPRFYTKHGWVTLPETELARKPAGTFLH